MLFSNRNTTLKLFIGNNIPILSTFTIGFNKLIFKLYHINPLMQIKNSIYIQISTNNAMINSPCKHLKMFNSIEHCFFHFLEALTHPHYKQHKTLIPHRKLMQKVKRIIIIRQGDPIEYIESSPLTLRFKQIVILTI